MAGKVSKQGAVVAKPAVRQSAKAGPVEVSAPEVRPQLSARALRRTGKTSGFTGSVKALPDGSRQQLVSDAPVMRVGSASTMQRLRDSGGQLPTEPQQLVAAEGAVANNPGVNQEWSMAALKKDPRKFLRNVVQLDGALGSTLDRTACGPTSLLMGMISGRPESIQELAGKLVDAKGNLTGFGKNLAQNAVRGMKPEVREARAAEVREELQQAATRLRDGRAFTPADVTTLANCMQGVETLAGAAPNDLREAAIAIERLGVKVPPMELQLFGKPDGTMGHWRVVSRGTQFNPWPNDKGQSTQLPAKQGLESGKRDGAGWVLRDTVTVGSD